MASASNFHTLVSQMAGNQIIALVAGALAEIFLEVAIVTCSIAILTKHRGIWLASAAVAAAGVVVALTVLRIQ